MSFLSISQSQAHTSPRIVSSLSSYYFPLCIWTLRSSPWLTPILNLSLSHRSSKAHPGPVVHISDNPMDEGKVWRCRHNYMKTNQHSLTWIINFPCTDKAFVSFHSELIRHCFPTVQHSSVIGSNLTQLVSKLCCFWKQMIEEIWRRWTNAPATSKCIFLDIHFTFANC